MSHVSDLRTCNRTPETTGCRVTRPFSSYMFKPDETLFEFNGSMEHLLVFDIQVRTPTPLTYECIDCTLPQMEAGAAAAGIYFRVVNLQMGIDPSTLRISTVGASDWPDTPVGSLSATTMTVSQATPGFTHTYVTVQPDQSNGYIARVETYHGARGWGYTRESASVFVGYTTPLALVDNPTGCLQPRTNCTFGSVAWTNTGTTEDAASTDAWKCVNADYSRTIGPVNVGTGHWGQLGPLYPGEPMGGAPICYDAVARNYQCSYPQAPGPVDTCTPYEQDPQCKFLRSECEPSNVDPVTGRCIMHTQHWDCGVDTPVPGGTTTTTTTSCAGPIRCMGIECVEPTPPEKNPNFNQAAAQLGMVQWMDSDKDCVAGGNCTIFKGTGMSCRDVFWGVQNCCDSPTNTTLADYLKLTYYTYKLTNWTAVASYMESAGMGGLTSGFEALQSTLSTTWTDLTQPVVDAWQSLASDFMPDLASAVEDFSVDTIKDTAKEYLVEWGKQVFGEAFATYGGEAAVSSMIDSASVVVDFISTFMMYYAIAMILIQIIWACEPSEFELATKKELKSCHYIGAFCSQSVLSVCTEKSHSYCCYNSPLGRIIQEQVRAQLGLPWPTPEAVPVCDGLTIAQMQSVNWDAIDLTEWLGYLKLAGLHPNSVADGDTMYAGDRITTYVNAPGTQGMTTKDVTQQAIGAPNKPMNNVNQAATKMWGGLP